MMQENKKWLIYKHTLTSNCPHCGWSYIGLTSRAEPNKRWKNGNGYREDHQKVFYRAIQRYGWENFTHEILEDNIESLELANEREKFWIAYYHTYIADPECRGYNMAPGGDSWGNLNFHWYNNGILEICVSTNEGCPDGFKPGRLSMTEEQKSKLRGHKLSASHKQKISEFNSGRVAMTNGTVDKKVKPDEVSYYESLGFWHGKSNGIRHGFKHSEATLEKIRASAPHRKLTAEEKEHLRQVNLGKKHSVESKQHMRESQQGFRWYTDGITTVRAKEQPDGFWAGTSRVASEETRAKLSAAGRGRVVSEETKLKLSKSLKGINCGHVPDNAIKIKCLETGLVYNSIRAAIDGTGISYNAIKAGIDSGRAATRRKDGKKFHFIIWED